MHLGTIQVEQQVKIKILGSNVLAALPSPLANTGDWAEVKVGCSVVTVEILWITFGSMIPFCFHEKLYFIAQDISTHHISVP